MATTEELRGFTIERLRELCAERHITFTSRKKEELIAALMETEGEPKTMGPGTTSPSPPGPSSAELFDLILTLQRQQMAWMESQQRRQEEWMHLQQEAQRDMMEKEMVQLWSMTYTLPKLPQSHTHTHFCRKGPTGNSPATERLAAN